MTAFERQIRAAVYRSFVETSRPPTLAGLTEEMAVTSDEVRTALRNLAEAHMLVLHPNDEVWMAMPFSAVPTTFRVTSGARSWDANCAWDAFGISAVIQRDTVIHTDCPDCGELVSLPAGPDGFVATEGVVHFLVPAAQWWHDIGFT